MCPARCTCWCWATNTRPTAGAGPAPPSWNAQEYRIDEQRCRNGRRVVMSGGSLLAGQWAVYDLLQRLGVRYFHPEQTLYPRGG